MCIFKFNNKIKLNSLTDIMTTSVNKAIKLDTKISIPENFVGLIYYSDKYLFSLPTGDYKFQVDTFNKVIKSNKKKFKENEKPSYNFLLHYINLSRQIIELDFSAIASFKQKVNYHLKAVYEITNPQEFASEMLITWYKTTNKRTYRILRGWFKEFAIENFRKKLKQNQNVENQILDNANKYFKRYGINICDIKIAKSGETIMLEEILPADKNPSVYPETKPISDVQIQERFCPNCQSKVYQNADYCHACGYQFVKDFSFKNNKRD